jgi:hypothetical protein
MDTDEDSTSLYVVHLPPKPTKGPEFNFCCDSIRTVSIDLLLDETKEDPKNGAIVSYFHDNGWVITGTLHVDYYIWCTCFTARYNKDGSEVRADFDEDENVIYATNKETWQLFVTQFPEWESEFIIGEI